jgi:hypothetical protein
MTGSAPGPSKVHTRMGFTELILRTFLLLWNRCLPRVNVGEPAYVNRTPKPMSALRLLGQPRGRDIRRHLTANGVAHISYSRR